MLDDETMHDNETIKLIIHCLGDSQLINIFDKINNEHKRIINTKYLKDVDDEVLIKAIKYDCYLFLIPFDNLFREYLTDILCSYFIQHRIKIQTRSVTIQYFDKQFKSIKHNIKLIKRSI